MKLVHLRQKNPYHKFVEPMMESLSGVFCPTTGPKAKNSDFIITSDRKGRESLLHQLICFWWQINQFIESLFGVSK